MPPRGRALFLLAANPLAYSLAVGSIPEHYEHAEAGRDQLVQQLARLTRPGTSIASTVRLLNLVLDLSLAEQKALANFLESRNDESY